MSERPFMQIHVGGLAASTLGLSTEQFGAYSLLLMAAWQQDGSIPADMTLVREIARLSPQRWLEVWRALSGYFEANGDRFIPVAFKEWEQARARIFGRTPLPPALRLQIIDRDGARCRYCGTEQGPFHIDHIVPVARGGSDNPDNLGVACKPCNLSKGAKLIEVWL